MNGPARRRVTSRMRRATVLAAATLAATSITTLSPGAPTSAAASTAALVPVTPTRLADTRRPACGCDVVDARTIEIDVRSAVPSTDGIVAAVVTVTGLRTQRPGFVTAHPADVSLPPTSTLNTGPTRNVANTAIVPVGADGRIRIHRSEAGDVVVDLTAVFVAAATSRSGRFVAVAPRRIVDTRAASPIGPGGSLPVPLPNGVAADATAVVVNVTSVRDLGEGFLSTRPAGVPPVDTSVLNPDGSGRPLAASVVVPVSPAGFVVDSFAGGDVAIDLLGWFTGPSAAESATGLFVPTAPTRLDDTRRRPGRIHPGGEIEVAAAFPGAAALATNVTVVRPDHGGYVTARAAGTTPTSTSTVNPVGWNQTVANFAITTRGARGLAYTATTGTDLAVDVTGWFTGEPVESTRPPGGNDARRSRVLLVGDSTLEALEVVPAAQSAFLGFDGVVDAESCRRLLRPSCRSSTTGRTPNTVVDAIATAPGPLDIVVVKAGYNDWFSDFPAEFDAVVRAARGRGAHTIVWLSYNTRVGRARARQAYLENNADLRVLATSSAYPDVVLADWLAYSDTRQDWFVDGTHLTGTGTWALADYVSRWVAAVEHRPCPRPWQTGIAVPDPCPPPEIVGPVGDPRSLYP